MSNNMDYEQQFQADLERAQALSLESLALEKYRMQKQLSIKSSDSTDSAKSDVVKVEQDETSRSESFKLKSRPRPGTLNSKQPSSMIAPPPSNQRRNSCQPTVKNEEPDLISFTSPPSTNKLIDFCEQAHRSIEASGKRSVSLPSNKNAIVNPIGFNLSLLYNRPPVNYSQPFHSYPMGQMTVQSGADIVVNNPLTQLEAPPLPPKFVLAKPPPLPLTSSSSGLDVLKVLNKQDNSNLIDLTPSGYDNTNHNRFSVLEAFDPLCEHKPAQFLAPSTPDPSGDDAYSVCSGSMYEEYDPFDYLYSGSGGASTSEPIYATLNRSEKVPVSPPPLPPRHSHSMLERRTSKEAWAVKKSRLYENITISKRRSSIVDCDLKAYYELVRDVRSKFKHTDPVTNSGMVISPLMKNQYKDETSIKLCIYPQLQSLDSLDDNSPPVIFTCDVTCSIEHVMMHVVCELDAPPDDKYALKVWGLTEYLAFDSALQDYEYVHNCIKLEQDVLLCLVSDSMVDRSLARTARDDRRDESIALCDLLPNEPVIPISHDDLIILLETLEKEMDRVESAAKELDSVNALSTLKHVGVVQAVRAVCTLMGSLETPEISDAISTFIGTCENHIPQQRIGSVAELVGAQCIRIREAVQGLIEMYCHAYRVNFQLGSSTSSSISSIMVSEIADWVTVRICALHRIPLQWKHDNYEIEAQVYHGTRRIGNSFHAPSLVVTTGVQSRIIFSCDLHLDGVSMCTLARESRLVFVLYGFTLQPSDSNENTNESQCLREELGWAAFQFFNYEGVMCQGNMLLSLWPPAANRKIGPAPCPGSHPLADHPILGIELISPHSCVMFPSSPRPLSPEVMGDFNSLDDNTQLQLLDIIEQDTLSNPPVDVREVLWEKRHYLYHMPAALPKVLLAAHSWDWASLTNLHEMLHKWIPMQPLQALQLLLPTFPDMEVRRFAVEWIKTMSNDELVDYLPQLVQALKYETYETSPLTGFLLERALASVRVAHHLYWLLTHTLPGQCPQNSTWDTTCRDEAYVCAARHHRRLQLMLRALLAVSGEALRNCMVSQQLLVKNLFEISEEVKHTKESLRLKSMCTALETVHQNLVDSPNCLPLSLSLRVAGVQVHTCSYFPSNTLPLKINFLAPDTTVVPAIFKAGDDLRQDMLTLQMVRIMNKLWLREGLDLKMVTFACIPTGNKRGMIEMVSNAETLRKIQVEWGLTGSFKDKPIAEWLAKHNPSELEYERARENFTASCAGYSVVTYILGICDRHNDNIMLKTSGHLFHIDFGKFLGDAQMFGNFKRDRTPFVLTSDMAFVINGGDRPSERFHKFVDLCCQAFNIVRANGNLILNLFTFMASSGIPGVTTEAVSYVKNALLPIQSNPEAAATFARLIQSSLKSWFTQFNFFLHNLAQLRFTGDHGDGELLSFVPKTYSMSQDGRLRNVTVFNYEKRYDPDKYYVYILVVEREGQPHPINIFRTYKEFCELHQKLCLHYPLAKIHSLPTGIHMGRSNIKQVAEKRFHDIRLFVYSLFRTADEIAHSKLVYTFFHPMLRDQQNIEVHNRRSKDRKGTREDVGRVRGQLKLTLLYQRDALSVMVHHARSLPLIANMQEPSTYVKVYLHPDPTKSTKRKTKVVKRSCHPSFMEMLEYRMTKEIIKSRTLQATVWSHDSLQENEFLGGVALELSQFDLSVEMTEWFPLTNLPR